MSLSNRSPSSQNSETKEAYDNLSSTSQALFKLDAAIADLDISLRPLTRTLSSPSSHFDFKKNYAVKEKDAKSSPTKQESPTEKTVQNAARRLEVVNPDAQDLFDQYGLVDIDHHELPAGMKPFR